MKPNPFDSLPACVRDNIGTGFFFIALGLCCFAAFGCWLNIKASREDDSP